MGKVVLILAILCSFLSLTGCSEPYLSIAAANADLRRGEFQKALGRYLDSVHRGKNGSVISYNIGNVYYYLGEKEKALEMWNTAASAGSSVVRYRSYFNSGILQYGMNDMEAAAGNFLEAVKIFPGRDEAKINLEYCIVQLEAARKKQSGRTSTEDLEDRDSGADNLDIYIEMLMQTEEYMWGTEGSTESTGTDLPDY